MQTKSEIRLNEIATSELILDLDLPRGTVNNVDGQMFLTFDQEQFAIILKIYKTYEILARINRSLAELVENTEKQRNIAIVAAYKCVDVLETVDKDRIIVHKIRDQERAEVAIRERKSKIKNVLIVSGTGIAGVGLGILIGFFARR